jgi:hypothetical protein
MKKLTLSITAAVLLLTACNKKDDPTPTNNTTNSKKDLLMNGEWQWDGLWTVQNPGASNETTTDVWSSVKDCDKDDRITFAANSKGTVDEKANKCDSDVQTESFGWELTNNETILKITEADGKIRMLTIVELTASKSVYRERVEVSGSDSMTIEQAFKKF